MNIKQLYETHWYIMYLCAFKILKNKLNAEDIVSDVFSMLLLKPERLAKVEDHIDKYLYWKTKMKCLDFIDSYKRTVDSDDIDLTTDDFTDLELLKLKSEMIIVISKLATTLSTKSHRLFNLLYVDGKSNEEIGVIMHLNYQSVRNAKSRLSIQIRKLLGKYYLLNVYK